MKLTPPTPFCITIDTREQHPIKFPDGTPTITATCYPGDYSVVGLRHRIAIERKGVALNNGVWTSDLVSTITELLRGQNGDTKRGSLRFRWELLAMSKIIRSGGLAFVVTDRPRKWYADHAYFGGLHPSALFGTIRSLIADYSVPFMFSMMPPISLISCWEYPSNFGNILTGWRPILKRLTAPLPRPTQSG